MSENSDYFKLSVKFFNEYKWVFDFKATEILTDNVMQAIPLDFQEYFKGLDETSERFRDILNLKDNDDWPAGIRKFIIDCLCLRNLSEEMKRNSTTVEFPTSLLNNTLSKPKLPKKWNPKKYAEVVHVGNFVGNLCKRESCDTVIDIGSGLGYLSQHIASHFEIPVVGIESDASRVQTATNEYRSKSLSTSSACQTYVCLRITENIADELNPITENVRSVCLTALHACGDLTPWSLKYFINTDACKFLAVVPCCYHKMSLDATNFPMSLSLLDELQFYEDVKFLKNQWLWRLASQRSGLKFLDNIKKETKNIFYRAILQRYCLSENLVLRRKKRNLNNYIYETFDEYLEKTIGVNGGFDLLKNDSTINEADISKKFDGMLYQYNELLCWSHVITGTVALQGAMQQIAEDLILLDRLRFIQESELVKASGLVQVIPAEVSPRGMVLFGIKK